jgi:hypothetical protein
MKPLRVVALAMAIAAAATVAGAQSNTPQAPGSPPAAAPPAAEPMGSMPMGSVPMGSVPMHHPMSMHRMNGMPGHEAMGGMMMHGPGMRGGMPVEPGEAAFGAVQEIVRILQADSMTNWSKVDIDALRQHLIDMDEVTLRADAQKEPIENGLRIKVTGSGRTLEAIQRMIPAHAQDINGLYGWTVQARAISNGEELTVTASSPADVQKIRALGFMGIMVQGTHQMHHLAIAKGEMMHMH